MKILMVITELGPGGAERIVCELSKNLLKKGHSVTVVSIAQPPDTDVIPRQLTQAGIPVRYLNGTRRDLKLFSKLRKMILQEKPDVIHAHLIHANLLCRVAAAGTRIPLVDTIHIAEKRKNRQWYFLLDALTQHLADVHTAVSHAAAEFHEKHCFMKPGSIRVIYNASDTVDPASPETLQAVSANFKLEEFDRVIGSIGRLDYQKGYDWFLERAGFLSRIIPSGQKWAVLIFGEGPERAALTELADRAEHSYRNLKIFLPGYRPDAASLM